MAFDLTSIQGVEEYLSQTPFAASNVIPLAGGNANFTYRILLQKPYNAGSGPLVHSLVLKHAEPYVATIRDIPFLTERQDYESMALKNVGDLTHPSPIVSVPRLYYEDPAHRVLLMADCGDSATTLKRLFQTTPPSLEISRVIGTSLGVFLARLHNATSIHGSPGHDIKAFFDKNLQARRITGLITYGKLVSTISPASTDPDFFEPHLDVSAAELDKIAILAKTMQDRNLTTHDVLAMGDFWPGNMIVSFSPELHVDVVDWEAVRPGLAGLEIGQFLAEMYSLRNFHPSSLGSVDVVVSSFLTAYRDIAFGEGSAAKPLEVAWDAATHFGTHLVTWTPRVPWGSKQQTREVALEGLKYILHATDKDDTWLQTSIVGDLLG
ncbi:hypothetical protein K439DRAFT_1325854 [Ramaria rubella]|nr:hypothetical protein K439DRAFT_1325854 [Ramaria rubella]